MKRLVCILVGLVLAGSLAQIARAANLVLNPGFESQCGILVPHPCNWVPDQGTATIDLVTAPKRSGSSSLRVIPSGPGFGGAVSDCISATPGAYSMSYYSTFADSRIGAIWGGVAFYSDASCTTLVTGQGVQEWPNFTRDASAGAQWHQAGGTATAPGGTQFAIVYLEPSCATAQCDGASAAYFDDVDLEQLTSTAVRLRSFTARGALLRWRTASELDTLGFNIYRGGTKLNRRLIAAKGRGGAGAGYRFLDRTAQPGAHHRYRLQTVDLDGSRRWVGWALDR